MTVIAFPSWEQRKAAGDELEHRVGEILGQHGWSVSPWGQGLLTEQIRSALCRTESQFRHEPDLIATRGSEIVAVDCKGTVRGGANFTINCRSLAALRRFAAAHDIPVYCVFDDLTAMTPDAVMTAAQVTRLGSAGAYVRVRRGIGQPFERVFGGQSERFAA